MASDVVKALRQRERELIAELKKVGKSLAAFVGSGTKKKITRRKRKALGDTPQVTNFDRAATREDKVDKDDAVPVKSIQKAAKKKEADEKAQKRARAAELKQKKLPGMDTTGDGRD